MKLIFFFLCFIVSGSPDVFLQTALSPAALRYDGVYFTKPQRLDFPSNIWTVRCLRFYKDKTLIMTSEVYPDNGFDMSRYGKWFSKENLQPEIARGRYTYRNDSLLFSTESYFTGETKQHTIKNHYRILTIGRDSLTLERRTQYDEMETRSFYFRAFIKQK